MAKTTAKTTAPAAAPGDSPEQATEAAVPDAPLPMPTQGGCWVRNPDGSLSPDPAEHPAEE